MKHSAPPGPASHDDAVPPPRTSAGVALLAVPPLRLGALFAAAGRPALMHLSDAVGLLAPHTLLLDARRRADGVALRVAGLVPEGDARRLVAEVEFLVPRAGP